MENKFLNIFFSIILLSTFYFLFSQSVFAQPSRGYFINNSQETYFPNNPRGGSVGLTNPLAHIADDIPGLIAYVINVAKWLAGLVAVLVIIYGAYQILFSAGDPKGWEKGKNTIVYALIGFALILIADILVGIINDIVGY